MKISTWNVNGIRAVLKRGDLQRYVTQANPDILCLQETKAQEGQVDLGEEFEGYHAYWNSAVRKGYSGTLILTKTEPLSVSYGIGIEAHDQEGRVITAEYEDFYVVTVYTPNAKRDLTRLAYRQVWEDDFLAYLKSLEATKPVIFCGDLNVAHEEIDLARPKSNMKNAGFTQEERSKFDAVMANGFVDAFRWKYPDVTGAYSWWSYMREERARNIGWRIDYFVLSQALTDRIQDVTIRSDVMGSDHCPVELSFG